MSATRKALGGLDVNSSSALEKDEDGSGPFGNLKQLSASLNATDTPIEGESKITPKKRRIEAEKENMTTPGRSFARGGRSSSNTSTPVRTPSRDGEELNRSVLSSAGRSRDFGRTSPRSATRALNTSGFSTPGSSTKRKVGDVLRGGDHDPYHSQTSPKDMYPPEGEKAEETVTSRSNTDMQSSLMDRLRSIEENLTNLNKKDMTQEPPSPYISEDVNPRLKPSNEIKTSSKKDKAPPVSFMEPPPSNPKTHQAKPATKMVNKALRQSMAAARAGIEGDKREVASPLKGARPRPDAMFPLSDSSTSAKNETMGSSSSSAVGKEELDEEETENVDPNAIGAPRGSKRRGSSAGDESARSETAAAAAAEKDADTQSDANPPVHKLGYLEFRNHVLAARVAASHTLLRSKDKSRQHGSFIEQQLEHYRALNMKGKGKGKDKDRDGDGDGEGRGSSTSYPPSTGGITEDVLVEPANIEPLAPLGHQNLPPGMSSVPLTQMSLLRDKLGEWKGKYARDDGDEVEVEDAPADRESDHARTTSLGAHLPVLRSAEKSSKPEKDEDEDEDDEFSI